VNRPLNTPPPNGIWAKVIAATSLLLLGVAVVVAREVPAAGYELDIYSSTPLFTWIFLSLAMLGGAAIIIRQVANNDHATRWEWLLGLLVLMLARFTLLYIPYIRGYVSWHGDNISHWGLLKDVLTTGHLYAENYYPVTHSILAQTILVTGIPMMLVTNLSTALMSVLFIAGTYLLAKSVLPHRGQQILAVVVAALVMVEGGYNVFLMPNGWSILMLPILFCFFFRKEVSVAYVVSYVLLLALYPFFHPLSSFMVVVSLAAISVFRRVIRRFSKKQSEVPVTASSVLVSAGIEIVILIPWVLSFNAFRPNIRQMWEQITSGGPRILADMGDTLSKLGIHGTDLIVLYAKLYGAPSMLIILSLVALSLTWRRWKKGEAGRDTLPVLEIGLLIVLFGILYALYLVGTPGLQSIGAPRLISYMVVLTPIAVGVTLYEAIRQPRIGAAAAIAISMALVAGTSGLSVMDLYRSPYNLYPNLQITRRNMDGMEWFLANKDPAIICLNTLSDPPRLADAIVGYQARHERVDISSRLPNIPDHFGYDVEDQPTVAVTTDRYYVLNDVDRVTYETVWKKVGRFEAADFVRLEADPTVARLYANDETNVYYVAVPEIPH
jgi:hypothetical protein